MVHRSWLCVLLGSLLAIPASTRRWPSVGLMLRQRRRRWFSIEPAQDQRFVFAGISIYTLILVSKVHVTSRFLQFHFEVAKTSTFFIKDRFAGMVAYVPANTKYLHDICTRRWADVVQMLYKCFVFAGISELLLLWSVSYTDIESPGDYDYTIEIIPYLWRLQCLEAHFVMSHISLMFVCIQRVQPLKAVIQ